MKTSNKILMGFLIFIIAIPLVFVTVLKKILQSKHYTTVSEQEVFHNARYLNEMESKGQLQHFRIMKIVGPRLRPGLILPDGLQCHLHLAADARYIFRKSDPKDSLSFVEKGDTTIISYLMTDQDYQPNGDQLARRVNLDLYLPSWDYLVVDGAVLNIDSLNRRLQGSITVPMIQLLHKSTLNFGTHVEMVDVAEMDRRDLKDGKGDQQTTPGVDRSAINGEKKNDSLLPDIALMATTAHINWGNGIDLNRLQLKLDGGATLDIKGAFKTRSIDGYIGKDVLINAPAKLLRGLQPLIKDPAGN